MAGVRGRGSKRQKSSPKSKAKSSATPVRTSHLKEPIPQTEGITKRPSVFAGFHLKANKLATLDEIRDPDVPTRTIGELSHSQLVRLVCARIARDKSFIPLHMLGVNGIVDKSRALKEIRSGSHVGLHLIDIEKEYISLQLPGTK